MTAYPQNPQRWPGRRVQKPTLVRQSSQHGATDVPCDHKVDAVGPNWCARALRRFSLSLFLLKFEYPLVIVVGTASVFWRNQMP